MINLNYEHMKKVCLSSIKEFRHIGDVTETKDGPFIFRDNPKAKIIAVAHLDTVLNMNHFYDLSVGKDTVIMNAQLDDRLGAYVLLDVLPTLGIEYDLLLTVGEEQGMSTAAYFDSPKSYNWMFSFDRHGDDVVMYQYESKELRQDLQTAKLKPAKGSFSDICFLDHLGIRGINVGTGYEGEHSDMCYASMNVLRSQINRFKVFYKLFGDKPYPYTMPTYNYLKPITTETHRSSIVYDRNSWGEYDDDLCYLCGESKGTIQITNDIFVCDHCIADTALCAGCNEVVYADELTDGICLECLEGRDDG